MGPHEAADGPTTAVGRVTRMRQAPSLAVVLAVVLAIASGACFVPRDADVGPGLEGLYVVNGTDPVGTEYSGTVSIGATDQPNVYRIEWLVTGGIQQGTGTLTGDRFEGTWTVVGSERGATSSGTFTYRVGDDHVLRGTRTVDGTAGEAVEEIFPGN